MPRLFNWKATKKFRRQLRNDPPLAERIMWGQLHKRLLLGYKFRRQQGIGRYIVDFYCPELHLAVELDGDSHFGASGRLLADSKRQAWLERNGITVVRFTNDQVIEATEYVISQLQKIVLQLAEPPQTPP